MTVPMFNPFRPRHPTFDIAAIGNHWVGHPLTHDGIAGTLRVRLLPPDVARERFPLVALAWSDQPPAADAAARTEAIQAALERDRSCLLVLVHETAGRTTWYAYSSSQERLDKSYGSLRDRALHWGINDDPGWAEYDHARSLVGT